MKEGFGKKKTTFKEIQNLCPKNEIPRAKKVKYHRRSEKNMKG